MVTFPIAAAGSTAALGRGCDHNLTDSTPALGRGCDHNLTDNTDNTPLLTNATHWLGAISGFRVDSDGPTYLIGTAFEHHRAVQYNITGASHVTLVAAQTENAYWPAGGKQPGVPSPACDARALLVHRSSNVSLYGGVWCGWFCHVSGTWANFSGSSNVSVYGVWTVGADSVAGEVPGQSQVAAMLLEGEAVHEAGGSY